MNMDMHLQKRDGTIFCCFTLVELLFLSSPHLKDIKIIMHTMLLAHRVGFPQLYLLLCCSIPFKELRFTGLISLVCLQYSGELFTLFILILRIKKVAEIPITMHTSGVQSLVLFIRLL